MTRSEAIIVLQKIFIETFSIDGSDITDATTSDDIKKWDSLNHIILFKHIEAEFNVGFALGEMAELLSFGAITDALMIKLSSDH